MAKKIVRIKDIEQWTQLLEDHRSKLLVVDAHVEWCGPTTVMEPTYNRIYGDLENAENRVVFVTVPTHLEIPGIDNNESCKPKFLLFKGKGQKLVETVLGANAPVLEKAVHLHAPEAEENPIE